MGHIFNYISQVQNVFPWISFLAGLGGSLHCVGMCGGLVTASCSSSQDIFRYQTGRLIGYLFLGSLAAVMGFSVESAISSIWFSRATAILMGLLFIYWGYNSFRGKKTELPLPAFLHVFYKILWVRFVKNNSGFSRSFFIGLISIMLPCGLLYGIVLGTVALGQFHQALFSMFFFWLGTLPAMVVAPGLIRKIILPFKSKLPKSYALSLMFLGVVTVTWRILEIQSAQYCH